MEAEKTAGEEQETREKEVPIKKKTLPVNIIVAVILFLCLSAGVVFVWKTGLLAKAFEGGKKNASALADVETTRNMGPIYSMETFIVNLVGDRGKSYLKAKIELELSDEKLNAEINKRLPQLRDSVLTMLSNKTNDDIKTLEGKYQLRAEIISTLNQFLTTGKIMNVFFTDFIVQ